MRKILTIFLSLLFVFIVSIQGEQEESTSQKHGKSCPCQCCVRAFRT